MHRRAILLLAALSAACNDPVSFSGTWSGSNERYASVVLTLAEGADSVSGSLQVMPVGGSPFTTSVNGVHTDGDLSFRGDPLPPSVGPGFATTFSGGVTFGGRLTGCLGAREAPCTRIVLHR